MSEQPEPAPKPAVPGFEVVVRPSGEAVVVELHGELCMSTAPQATERIGRLLDEGCKQMVLDLRGVEFMDSNGVRMLIETDERARAESLDFAIALDRNQPSHVLELVGLVDRPRRVEPEDLPGASR